MNILCFSYDTIKNKSKVLLLYTYIVLPEAYKYTHTFNRKKRWEGKHISDQKY